MSSILPAVAGFFPPRPARSGDAVVFCQFAAALARHIGPLNVVFAKERTYPGLLPSFNSMRMTPISKANEAPFAGDIPSVVMPPSLDWLIRKAEVAQLRCVVGVSPSVDDVRSARDLRARLFAAGLIKDQVWLLLWNHGVPGGLPIDMIEEELGAVDAVLPFDLGLVCRAENGCCLIEDINPRAGIVVALEKLAVEAADWMKKPMSFEINAALSAEDLRRLESRVTASVWETLSKEMGRVSSDDVQDRVDRALQDALGGRSAPVNIAALRQRVIDHVAGLGPLEELLRDSAVSEIMVNGPREIFVERNGAIEKTLVEFHSEQQLRAVIDRVVGRVGRRVDLSSPLCDVRLPDGSRANVVLPPLSLLGPVITVRRFRTLYRTLGDLMSAGTLTEEQSRRLSEAVAERKNILVAGNSGAGKTTLLNVLAGLIPAEERILTLEDAAELQIERPHVVRLETRPANAEGLGRVSMADLVTNALRMRPDRLVIGECRGAEVIPMLQAMNTGHDGSMTTIHANSAADALKRLESLVLLHAPEWSTDVVREQVRAGIDIVIYVKRQGTARKLLEMADVE